jgi:hypothetical protein
MSRFLLTTNANQAGTRDMVDIIDAGRQPRNAWCMVHVDMFYDDKPICNKLRGGEEVEIEIKEVTE